MSDVQKIDYEAIHKNFQLIEQRNLSVFVPIPLPTTIESENAGIDESIFSKTELDFLSTHQCYQQGGEYVNGIKVWELYRELNAIRMGMTESQVSKKIMQGVLSKFTFSIFYTESLKNKLCPRYTGPKEDGFEDYLYLKHHDEIYSYTIGLDQNRFESSENCIL